MSKEKPIPDGSADVLLDALGLYMVDLEIRCHVVPWASGKIEFCVLGRTVGPNDQRRYAQVTNLALKTVDEGTPLEPTFALGRENVQALMDELWRIGVRPTEAHGPGELEATKAHLRDMRILVANALDVPEMRPSR